MSKTYTTQMDAARKGIVTPQMETVAKKEHMPVEDLMKLVSEGKVAICANKNHKCLDAEGVGSMLRTKINVNLGVSRDCKDYDIEIVKTYFQDSKSNKSMFIRVTDKELLSKTGGIVQGMSGSPIIQNGKLVGAVTHVFVSDPTKGYGIYADWMIDN